MYSPNLRALGHVFKVVFNRLEFRVFPSRLVSISRLKRLVYLTIYLIAEWRIVGGIPFQMLLTRCELQTVCP